MTGHASEYIASFTDMYQKLFDAILGIRLE